jgi:hypothetical protein
MRDPPVTYRVPEGLYHTAYKLHTIENSQLDFTATPLRYKPLYEPTGSEMQEYDRKISK